ncbi:glutaminase [Microbacterium sp. P03]|uniref:glutaminase n=1 Tax=Microbacterium sp. P03 TaxID=3366946 RepID=UPI0037471459
MTDLHGLFSRARERLEGAPQEALGDLLTGRRFLGIARADRIKPYGEAWHLGVLLLTADEVLATGEIVRARTEAPRGYTAESQRARSALAAAAARGGFPDGRAVHVGWRRLDLDAIARGAASVPLSVVDGEPLVQWSGSAMRTPLAGYLDERVELLLRPPLGAN